MSELRFNVLESAFYKKATTVEVPERRPCDYFGNMFLVVSRWKKRLQF